MIAAAIKKARLAKPNEIVDTVRVRPKGVFIILLVKIEKIITIVNIVREGANFLRKYISGNNNETNNRQYINFDRAIFILSNFRYK